MPLAPGKKLGPYEILAALGAGAMGEVYRARDPRLGREVAIKILPGSAGDSERMRRFEQEARATAALSHPNILAVFDIGSQDNSPYIVSELLEGETLRARLISGPLPVRKAVDYALQTARGLTAAHNHGIFHRDLKPENLFITRDGHVKILDFGLAKLTMPELGAPGLSAEATLDSVTGRGAGKAAPAAGVGCEARRGVCKGVPRCRRGFLSDALWQRHVAMVARASRRCAENISHRERHACRSAFHRVPRQS